MEVDILGTKYNIIIDDAGDPELKAKGRVGYCFPNKKEIHVADLKTDEEWQKESFEVRKDFAYIVLRHEIIHAFLYESGLKQNSLQTEAWAENEEMVDWIATQFPKMLKAFNDTDCI